MASKRDNQRSKVYAAENRAKKRLREKGRFQAVQFESVQEVEQYVNRILRSQWWKKNCQGWLIREVRVKDGRGTTNASAHRSRYGCYINIPRWARNELVVLHELAHIACSNEHAPHGREFSRMFLSMVKRWMGREAWEVLREEFKAAKVKYSRAGSKNT